MTTKINADLNQAAFVDSTTLPWIPSPLKGVHRRMLDRDGDEVARATSLVRYDAGSFFSPHSHPGGEEFLVLSGVFSDESGDFPKGFYVRNPVGTKHQPYTDSGCLILVKLRQMYTEDQARVRVDTLQAEREPIDGVPTTPLHQFGTETVLMRHLATHQHYTEQYSDGCEIFVVDGAINLAALSRNFVSGGWFRLPETGKIEIEATAKATLLVKRGHLAC